MRADILPLDVGPQTWLVAKARAIPVDGPGGASGLVKAFFFFNFIYLRKREREQAGGGAEEQTDSSLSREPDVGPDLRTLRP